MIRIDLKEDELSKDSGGKEQIVSQFLGKIKGGDAIIQATKEINHYFILIVIVAIMIAISPSLLLDKHKQKVTLQYDAQIKELNQAVNVVQGQIRKLSAFKAELDSYEKQKALVKKRLSAVGQLVDVRGSPVYVLNAIGQSLPRRTWLSSLNYEVKDGEVAITLAGRSYSNEEISDFLDRLAESIYLKEVVLENVSVGHEGAIETKTFNIKAKSSPS